MTLHTRATMHAVCLRLGVFGLLVHDVQDHAARGRAALRRGVDADRLLGGAGVLLAVHVDPVGTHRKPLVYSLEGSTRVYFFPPLISFSLFFD